MKTIIRLSLTVFVSLLLQQNVYSQTQTMVFIRAGKYAPIYGRDSEKVNVKSFYMDVYPITNNDFRLFLLSHPQFRKSNIKKIFADGNYLNTWKNDTAFQDKMLPNAPVTNVSWFAANEYCKCQGKRLPTIDEWEYVAMADEKNSDARKLKSYNQYILSWYEAPKTFTNPIGKTFKNFWGVYDMHGLVWEWTADFNSVLISGESRKDSSNDRNLFCGSGSLGATDLMNYAAFMRYAFRGSIKAKYAVQNLGFRCVKNYQNK